MPSTYCVQDMCNVTSQIGPYYASMRCEDLCTRWPKSFQPTKLLQRMTRAIISMLDMLVIWWFQGLRHHGPPIRMMDIILLNWDTPIGYGHICALFATTEFDHLKTTVKVSKTVCRTMYTPQTFLKAGQYPTQFCFEYDDSLDSYRVYLNKFAYKLLSVILVLFNEWPIHFIACTQQTPEPSVQSDDSDEWQSDGEDGQDWKWSIRQVMSSISCYFSSTYQIP
jgi:hypothetical protein